MIFYFLVLYDPFKAFVPTAVTRRCSDLAAAAGLHALCLRVRVIRGKSGKLKVRVTRSRPANLCFCFCHTLCMTRFAVLWSQFVFSLLLDFGHRF
jgi:hypothetical protein